MVYLTLMPQLYNTRSKNASIKKGGQTPWSISGEPPLLIPGHDNQELLPDSSIVKGLKAPLPPVWCNSTTF